MTPRVAGGGTARRGGRARRPPVARGRHRRARSPWSDRRDAGRRRRQRPGRRVAGDARRRPRSHREVRAERADAGGGARPRARWCGCWSAAGASVELKGSGAPGFAGKSAYDLAVARGDDASAALLQPLSLATPPDPLPRFLAPDTWDEAAALMAFTPRRPADTRGRALRGLRVHVRDHRRRDLPLHLRTFEAHYDGVAVCQSRPGASSAKRRALEVRYGEGATAIRIAGHEGRAYPLGPEVPPDDIDGRSAAVVTWADGAMFHFVMSTQLPVDEVTIVAASLYADGRLSRVEPSISCRSDPSAARWRPGPGRTRAPAAPGPARCARRRSRPCGTTRRAPRRRPSVAAATAGRCG